MNKFIIIHQVIKDDIKNGNVEDKFKALTSSKKEIKETWFI